MYSHDGSSGFVLGRRDQPRVKSRVHPRLRIRRDGERSSFGRGYVSERRGVITVLGLVGGRRGSSRGGSDGGGEEDSTGGRGGSGAEHPGEGRLC